MRKSVAICLVSGGLDSGVTAAMAAREYLPAFLHISYGQLTAERELKAFRDLADYFKVPPRLRMVVKIDYLKRIGGSSLTDEKMNLPAADPGRREIPSSYVPFRNANILSIAVAWAEVLGADKIFIGAMEEDSSGYPDCRQEFYEAFNRVVEIGTRPETRIKVETPIIHMSKAEVIGWGMENGVPLHLTWSCYRSSGPRACGLCESCALRLRGFRQAGFKDLIPYESEEDES